MVAITGSAGKTTTKDILYSILSLKYNVVKTIQNQNNEIGVPLTILSADADTEILLVECGIRKPDDMKLLVDLVQPTQVIITHVGTTHVEFFKNTKDLARQKSMIFKKALKWQHQKRTAFITTQSLHYDLIQKKAEKTGYAVVPIQGENKTQIQLELIRTVATFFDLSDDEINIGISKKTLSENRQDICKKNNITIINDSYNSNPDSMTYALEKLTEFKGRKIGIFADMKELGKYSAEAHMKVCKQAKDAGITFIYTLGEFFNNLDQNEIEQYKCNDIEMLTELLKYEIKANDIILVKGSRSYSLEKVVTWLKSII